MPLIINHSGDTLKTSLTNDERTSKGPTFRSVYGKETYFPIPNMLSSVIPVVGKYIVPEQYSERPDLIAKDLYGSEDFWWVIFWSNDIIDPFGQPRTNSVLKIVDIKKVKELLS